MIEDSEIMLILCTIGVFTAVLSLANFIDGCNAQGILFLFISLVAYIGGWALDDD